MTDNPNRKDQPMTDDETTWVEFTDGDREFIDAVHSLVNQLLAQEGGPQSETPTCLSLKVIRR